MNKISDITLLLATVFAVDVEDRQQWHDDEINVTVERNGETKRLHFKERDWDDIHGDEIFNISWLGTIASDDYWENINDEFDNADLDAPAAFDNQVAERTDGLGHPLDCNFEPGTCRP